MTALEAFYAAVGAAVLGWKCMRIAAATALQVPITFGTAAALVLQGYVAEVEDACPSQSMRVSSCSPAC